MFAIKKFFQAVVIMSLPALLFPSFIPGQEREGESPAGRDELQTRRLGRLGNMDTFLTGVVPDWPGWKRLYWTDKELWGNQGYIIGGPRRKMEAAGALAAGASEELTAIIEKPEVPSPPLESAELDILEEKPTSHTVVKGECLWYIAGYDHIYGNPLQWPLIYKANQDKIKNPDLIYPGQVFVIPRD